MSSSFLERENTIAPPGYNRFLFPPAALAVHLCIGQAYARAQVVQLTMEYTRP